MSHEPHTDTQQKFLNVVCAIIVNNEGKLLACRRNANSDLAGKWEFPGGKVEALESHAMALHREIMEELGVEIAQLSAQPTVLHSYHQPEKSLSIALHPFQCKLAPLTTPKALEHAELRWISPSEADQLDWAAADITVLDNFKQQIDKSPTINS